MQFYKLAPGAPFEYEGKRYRKAAMDVAQDENGQSRPMSREWEVSPLGEPLLLPEDEAEKWKPIDLEHWADHITPSPIELGDWGNRPPLK